MTFEAWKLLWTEIEVEPGRWPMFFAQQWTQGALDCLMLNKACQACPTRLQFTGDAKGCCMPFAVQLLLDKGRKPQVKNAGNPLIMPGRPRKQSLY